MDETMTNPGLFISAPQTFTTKQLAAFKRELSSIALAHGYQAYRGKARGSIFELLASIVSGEIVLVLLADEERDAAIRFLRRAELQSLAERDALQVIADALDEARQREEEE
jgi:hypothetical protein